MTVLICVGSCDNDFTLGKEYPVIFDFDRGYKIYKIKNNYGKERNVPLSGRSWQFKIKGEKYTAISGDQSLFELLQSPDDHLYVYRGINNNIFSHSELWSGDYHTLLAERKPAEYIPAIGDKFIDNNDKILTCHFIDGSGDIYSHNDKNEVFWHNPKRSTFIKV